MQLFLFDQSIYLLLQVIAVRCVMTVIIMKVAVLVSKPLIKVSLHLVKKCQGSFVFDLHQDLVNWGSQLGEAYEPPYGGFLAPILSSISNPCHLSSPVLPCLLQSFPFLRLFFSGQ